MTTPAYGLTDYSYSDPNKVSGMGAGNSDVGQVDLSDPELNAAKQRVLDRSDEADWALFSLVGQTNKVKVVGCDSGGLEECFEYLTSGRPAFGFVSIEISKDQVPKLLYFSWNPAGVPPMQKGSFHGRASDVGKWLSPFHLQVDAQSEDDLEIDAIRTKLAKAANLA